MVATNYIFEFWRNFYFFGVENNLNSEKGFRGQAKPTIQTTVAFRRALRDAVVSTEGVLLEPEHATQYPELFETLPMLMSCARERQTCLGAHRWNVSTRWS